MGFFSNLRDKAFLAIATPMLRSVQNNYFSGGRGNYGSGGGEKTRDGYSGLDNMLLLDHNRLRLNARNSEHDVPQIRSIIDRLADTTVDVGVKAKSTIKFKRLGISEQTAADIGEELDEGFDEWALSKKSHLSEINNFYQSQRMYSRWQHRDNDMFVRLHYGLHEDPRFRVQYSFTDPDFIMGNNITTNYMNGWMVDGIDRDDRGREIGYNVGYMNPKTLKFENIYIPAEKDGRYFMLHGFTPEYANQTRGITRFAHAIHNFAKIHDFDLAHVEKAAVQASINAYVKPSKTAAASDPFEHLQGKRGVQPVKATSGARPTEDPDLTGAVPGSPVNYYEVPSAYHGKGGGLFVTTLNKGEDMGQFKNDSPVTNYDIFMDTYVAYLSSSLGVPVSTVKMKFSDNYSASRGELLMLFQTGRIWLNEMVTDFCSPTRLMWLSEAVAAGWYKLPGWSDPMLRSAWEAATWHGAPILNIDPLKQAEADLLNVVIGNHTFDDAARGYNGSSGRANRAKIKQELSEFGYNPFLSAKGKEPGSKKTN